MILIFVSKVLTSNELSASDGESLPKELVYTVTHAPTFGKLGLLTDKNKVIYSFTQVNSILIEKHDLDFD